MAAVSPSPSPQARLTLLHDFDRFADTVTLDDQRFFNNTDLKDVRDEAIQIERQLRARRTQRNMARLEPFLQGVEHYSKVVEVLCNGTPYLSWIWAPVRLMLMVSHFCHLVLIAILSQRCTRDIAHEPHVAPLNHYVRLQSIALVLSRN